MIGLNLLGMFSFHQDGDGWAVYKTRMENVSSGETIRLITDVSVYPKQEREGLEIPECDKIGRT